jgi:general stress protein CsbA
VSLTIGPCLLVILLWLLLAPRWRVGVVIFAALLCAALIANALIVNT